MKTLTRTVEKRITDDWRGEIPSLGIYKPRHLLRRVGPLLVGICLDRDSGGDKYKPIFHVHSLCKEFPCVSMTLATQLRVDKNGGPDYIEVGWHEDKYVEAATRMVRQSPIAMQGDLSFADVVDAYRRYMENPPGIHQRAILYQDIILMAIYLRKIDLAWQITSEMIAVLDDDQAMYRHVGGREVFLSRCETALSDPSVIDTVVNTQNVELGLTDLPLSSLIS